MRSGFAYAMRRRYGTARDHRLRRPARAAADPRSSSAACRDADIVSGSRYLQSFPGDTSPPAERRRINQILTEELNRRLGLRLTDAFCGFKAYRVSAWRSCGLRRTGYAMPLEFWVQAAALGLKIVELPVPLIYLDEERSFGGALDNAETRLAVYRQVLDRAMAAVQQWSSGRPPARRSPSLGTEGRARGRSCQEPRPHNAELPDGLLGKEHGLCTQPSQRVDPLPGAAPREDRKALVEPPLEEVGPPGREQRRGPRRLARYDLQGRAAGPGGPSGPAELLREAHCWTSAYRDAAPLPARAAGADLPGRTSAAIVPPRRVVQKFRPRLPGAAARAPWGSTCWSTATRSSPRPARAGRQRRGAAHGVGRDGPAGCAHPLRRAADPGPAPVCRVRPPRRGRDGPAGCRSAPESLLAAGRGAKPADRQPGRLPGPSRGTSWRRNGARRRWKCRRAASASRSPLPG